MSQTKKKNKKMQTKKHALEKNSLVDFHLEIIKKIDTILKQHEKNNTEDTIDNEKQQTFVEIREPLSKKIEPPKTKNILQDITSTVTQTEEQLKINLPSATSNPEFRFITNTDELKDILDIQEQPEETQVEEDVIPDINKLILGDRDGIAEEKIMNLINLNLMERNKKEKQSTMKNATNEKTRNTTMKKTSKTEDDIEKIRIELEKTQRELEEIKKKIKEKTEELRKKEIETKKKKKMEEKIRKQKAKKEKKASKKHKKLRIRVKKGEKKKTPLFFTKKRRHEKKGGEDKTISITAEEIEGKNLDQTNFDEEVRKVLSITDKLLEHLPDEIIDNFVQSEDFALYEKVLTRYKIK